jgi:hypothetical protein
MSDYVLNTASVAEPYPALVTARVELAALLRGLALLDSDSDVLPSLRLNVDPWLHPFAREGDAAPLTLGELAHSFYGTGDHDLAEFFDSLNRSVPADYALDDASIDAILRVAPDSPATGFEQTFERVRAAGIDALICAAMNFTLVGMLRNNLWRFDRMGFVSGTETYLFDHVAEPLHAEGIRGRRMAALRSELSPRSFWSLRARVFSNLLFGLDVQGQVDKLNTTIVPLMFKRLAELDARARVWRESASDQFPDGTTEIKRETPRTMARYGNDRRFSGHDGATKTFEEHMWIDRSHRIHLILDVNGKRVEIGYIGRHLPTMEHPT